MAHTFGFLPEELDRMSAPDFLGLCGYLDEVEKEASRRG